ncbi:MAG: hypothetical protein KF686_01165 [Ramlibacter sp.]|nr:hypothetical protein [Ramlibacter sp.]MBX3660104.1 hypothetical protein [Ramlibacter sp.]
MAGSSRVPPRYVPTLTDVVRTSGPRAPDAVASVEGMQEQIVHRVMQRVDLSLERRLREAIATLVLEQTRNLGPLLRDEIETIVRAAVSEAVAQELASRSEP